MKRVRQHGGVGHDARGLLRGSVVRVGIFLRDHKAPAHRKIAALVQLHTVGIKGQKFHAVGVERQGLTAQKQQIGFFSKRDARLAIERDRLVFAYGFQAGGDGVGVNRVGHQAFQAQQHGSVGAVALAGGAQ